MQVDFLEIMESLFHIHNIEMTLIRLEDLPAETSDSTDILQKLTLDFKSCQISEAILKALKPITCYLPQRRTCSRNTSLTLFPSART